VSLQQTSLALTVPTTHKKGDIRDALAGARGFQVDMYDIVLNPVSDALPLLLAAATGPRISVLLPSPALAR
jgi:hypothetical protein